MPVTNSAALWEGTVRFFTSRGSFPFEKWMRVVFNGNGLVVETRSVDALGQSAWTPERKRRHAESALGAWYRASH